MGPVRRGTAAAVLAVALTAALSGCITVPAGGGQPTATQGSATPQSYVDRLKETPVDKPTDDGYSEELPQFVTDSRNVACVFTSSRAGNVNHPWEPNSFADSSNAAAALIPVVNCELAGYPQVKAADVADSCAGTNIGFLGGTALLSPDKATYGGCRAGVTAVEAAFGPRGTVNETMANIPVLAPGQAMDAEGYRCAPLDDGVACANLANGAGFFISAEKYELFGPDQATDKTAKPTAKPKEPVTTSAPA